MELANQKIKLTLSALFLAVLSGCASHERIKEVAKEADVQTADSQRAVETIREMPKLSLVETSDDFYVSTDAVWMSDKAKRLPAWFEREVSVNKTGKLNLIDVSEVITRDLGVKVTLTPDLAFNLRENGVDLEAAEEPLFDGGGFGTDFVGVDSTSALPDESMQDSTSALPPPVPVSSSSSGEDATAAGIGSMRLSYNGSLSGLLDLVSSRLNVFWRHEEGGVIFYQYDTRNFSLAVIPGSTELEATISNESEGSESDGDTEETTSSSQSSSQSTEMTGTFALWDELEDTLEAMLSENGAMALSQTSGTVTVTDNPIVMRRVEEHIENLNEVMTKQVTVSVKVYNITRNTSDSLGVNWNTIYNALSGDFSIGFDSADASGLAGDASQLTATILSPSSPFRDSNAIIRALSTQGKVSLVTSASVMTLNNQPVPVQVANQTTYLASSGIIGGGLSGGEGDVGLGATGTELRPGRVTTGFSMNILPRILDSRQLLMQYSIDLSSLDSLDDIVSGEQRIQAPSISTRNFMQRVALQSGDTLVLTGFESVLNDSLDSSSLGIPNNNQGERERNMTVIVMTPMVTQGIYR